MASVALTHEIFEQVVTGNNMVIVDFWASWCAPCNVFAPIFEEASERHADVVFARVNTEEEQELAAIFNIRSIPTLMLFREKEILYAEAGALPPAALEELLTKAREVDMAELRREIAHQGGAPA